MNYTLRTATRRITSSTPKGEDSYGEPETTPGPIVPVLPEKCLTKRAACQEARQRVPVPCPQRQDRWQAVIKQYNLHGPLDIG